MQRKVNVVEDLEGNKIVVIHDIIFKGKRTMEWTDVEEYLKRFVGEEHIIEDTGDLVYILDSRKRDEDTTSRIAANP